MQFEAPGFIAYRVLRPHAAGVNTMLKLLAVPTATADGRLEEEKQTEPEPLVDTPVISKT